MTAPLCPSAPAATGALLLGTVGSDGRLQRFGTPLMVDAGFADTAQRSGDSGRRYRFADTCAEQRCSHWSGDHCGLIGGLRRRAAKLEEPAAALPRCAIRSRCRWWQQDGAPACATCTLVVYDASPGSAR